MVAEHAWYLAGEIHSNYFLRRVSFFLPAVSPTLRRRPVIGRPVGPDETRAVVLRLTAGSELRLRLGVMLL
jgi:hypothetical protein